METTNQPTNHNILNQLKKENVDELYVIFDLDAIDDNYASATGTPELDGLLPKECMYLLRALAKNHPVTGADMIEIAPFTDSCGKGQAAQEITLSVAAEISAFLLDAMAKNKA